MSIKSCPVCLGEFESVNARRKYCSAPCKDRGKPSANRGVCSICGLSMQVKGMSAAAPAHNVCRVQTPAHGTAGSYKRGCRCDECKSYTAKRMRDYAAAYKDEYGVHPTTAFRRRFRDAHGRGYGLARQGRWFSAERRLLIYERDGWICQLCLSGVDGGLHWNDDLAPSLDHIVPVSLGGSSESHNLQLSHRVCNSRKGVSGV